MLRHAVAGTHAATRQGKRRCDRREQRASQLEQHPVALEPEGQGERRRGWMVAVRPQSEASVRVGGGRRVGQRRDQRTAEAMTPKHRVYDQLRARTVDDVRRVQVGVADQFVALTNQQVYSRLLAAKAKVEHDVLGQRINTIRVAGRGGEVVDLVNLIVAQVVGLAHDGRDPHNRHRIATR